MADTPALTIPLPDFLQDAALRAVLDAVPNARLVGGCVRDGLAGRPVADIDLATPLVPAAVIAALQTAGLRAVPTGLDHGTVTALSSGRGFEITTLRHDVETDGRHATVAFTTEWREDAARRDFTINAMSMTRDGKVFDYFGGIADLHVGRLRFVGDPAARIAEDYLRVLRFFRFHARYATVSEDDAHALAAMRAAVPHLAALSAERVWSELSRILATPDPGRSVSLMDELGVLAAVIPEGTDVSRLHRLLAIGAPADPILRTAALLAGDAELFSDRLRLSGAERTRLSELRALPAPRPEDDDATLRRLLADTPAELLTGRAWLAQACDLAGHTQSWETLRSRLEAIPRPVFPLVGRDVLALGIAPGPAVGGLLRAVRAWWMAGGAVADAGACRAELARRARG